MEGWRWERLVEELRSVSTDPVPVSPEMVSLCIIHFITLQNNQPSYTTMTKYTEHTVYTKLTFQSLTAGLTLLTSLARLVTSQPRKLTDKSLFSINA